MKIQGVHNQTFKGYDARPLKTLYMQKSTLDFQDFYYRELYDIGRECGFDVFMNYADNRLAKSPEELGPQRNIINRNGWAQDNKIFINKDGKTHILYTDLSNGVENIETEKLGPKINMETKLSSMRFEGGNIFLGTKDNGEKYALVGAHTIAEEIFKHNKNADEILDAINEYVMGVPPSKKYKKLRAEIEKTVEHLAQNLDVDKKNTYIINQPSFHLDMAIRPLKYPYVLVNDVRQTDKIMDGLGSSSAVLSDYNKNKLQDAVSGYATGEQTAKELKKYGFKPINIAGVYAEGINFMNAIVHEKNDGTLCYITNSCECRNQDYIKLQETFKKELKEKCPEVKDVHFVSGGTIGGKSEMMILLTLWRGGIHCLVAEEPKFDKTV